MGLLAPQGRDSHIHLGFSLLTKLIAWVRPSTEFKFMLCSVTLAEDPPSLSTIAASALSGGQHTSKRSRLRASGENSTTPGMESKERFTNSCKLSLMAVVVSFIVSATRHFTLSGVVSSHPSEASRSKSRPTPPLLLPVPLHLENQSSSTSSELV